MTRERGTWHARARGDKCSQLSQRFDFLGWTKFSTWGSMELATGSACHPTVSAILEAPATTLRQSALCEEQGCQLVQVAVCAACQEQCRFGSSCAPCIDSTLRLLHSNTPNHGTERHLPLARPQKPTGPFRVVHAEARHGQRSSQVLRICLNAISNPRQSMPGCNHHAHLCFHLKTGHEHLGHPCCYQLDEARPGGRHDDCSGNAPIPNTSVTTYRA
jgi:hypothetical protein